MRGRGEGLPRLLRGVAAIVLLAALAAAGAQAAGSSQRAARHDRETDRTSTDMVICRTGGVPYGSGPTDPGPDPKDCTGIPSSKPDPLGAIVFCAGQDQPIVLDSETQGYGTLYNHGVEAGAVAFTVVGPKPGSALAFSGTRAVAPTADPTMGHTGGFALPRLGPGTYTVQARFVGGVQTWHHADPVAAGETPKDHPFQITWLGSSMTGSFTVADCASDTIAVTAERIGDGPQWKASATDGACTKGLSYGWRISYRSGAATGGTTCPIAGTLPNAGKLHITLNRFAWRGFKGATVEKDAGIGGISFTSAAVAAKAAAASKPAVAPKPGATAKPSLSTRSFDVKVRLDDELTSSAGCDEKADYALRALAGTTTAKRTGRCTFRVAITPPDPPRRAGGGAQYVLPWIDDTPPGHDPLELPLAKRLEQWRTADRAVAVEAQCGDALDHGKLAEARDRQLKDAYIGMSLAYDALTQIQQAGMGELRARVIGIAAAVASAIVALPVVVEAAVAGGASTATIASVNFLIGSLTSLAGAISTFMAAEASDTNEDGRPDTTYGKTDWTDMKLTILGKLLSFASVFESTSKKLASEVFSKAGIVVTAITAVKGAIDAGKALQSVLDGMSAAADAYMQAGLLYNASLNNLRTEITLMNTAFSLCRLEVKARNRFGDVFSVTGATAKGSAPGAGTVVYARG